MKKIAIIGGGFGGIYTTKYLEKYASKYNLEITLFDEKNYFLFTPLLHEVATGALDEDLITEPFLTTIPKNTKFVYGRVEKIDLDYKKIFANNIEFDFDYIVVSTGSRTNTFGIESVSKNTLKLKTINDALSVKNKLSKIIHTNKEASIVVVGGGATGVELICEIKEYLSEFSTLSHSYYLIEASNSLISTFSKGSQNYVSSYLSSCGIVSMTNSRVSNVFEQKVILENGQSIDADLVIWTAGVAPLYPEINNLVVFDNKRIEINEFLQIQNYNYAFACGDVANGHPCLAQVAEKQAKILSKNLIKIIINKPLLKYKKQSYPLLLSLGHNNALFQIFNLHFNGKLIWFLWRTVYLFKIPTLKKQIEIAINWTWELFSKRDVSIFND